MFAIRKAEVVSTMAKRKLANSLSSFAWKALENGTVTRFPRSQEMHTDTVLVAETTNAPIDCESDPLSRSQPATLICGLGRLDE